MTIKKVAILTSGGDAPGLNGVIRAFVKSAINDYGWDVVGVEDGFEGMIGTPLLTPLKNAQPKLPMKLLLSVPASPKASE